MVKTWLSVLALVAAAACDRASGALPAQPSAEPGAEHDVTSRPDPSRPVHAVLTHAPHVPPRIFRKQPAHVIVELTVEEVEREIAPGVRYQVWTFGGEVPGKFIRVRQGDVVELRLQNHPSSKLPHNIDLHAVTGPGGGAESSFTAPGHESRFTFRALNPGLYVYHCATAPVPMHVANGMYGLILVEPPEGLPPVSREYYVMQGELYTVGKYREPGLQAFDLEKGIDERPTYVVFNGAEGSLADGNELYATTGDSVRIYFGNGGPNLTSNFHVIGEIFDRVYFEGGTRVQENVQTTLVPAGGAAIVDFTVEVPGTYILVDHALFRAFNKGAVGKLRVEGPPRHDLFTEKHGDRPYAGAAPVPTARVASGKRTSPGEATYARVCAACHQADGKGTAGVFPPLAGSDYLAQVSSATLIGHVLHGMQGPVTVLGTTYNGVMPPMAYLSDAEIATVLTYVRSAWGNRLGPIASGDVARVRAQPAGQP
jgi:nitrite reductase (NO-forming)